LGGGLVKAEWLKRYRDSDQPERFDRIVQSWDTANKATELSDFSVCTTWGVKGKDLFLLGLFRRRLEYPELKRAVREQQSVFGANKVLIEDKASGTQLIQELIADGCHGVTRYQPTCDKIMRMYAQIALDDPTRQGLHLPRYAGGRSQANPKALGVPIAIAVAALLRLLGQHPPELAAPLAGEWALKPVEELGRRGDLVATFR
jgi:hypothetical protein